MYQAYAPDGSAIFRQVSGSSLVGVNSASGGINVVLGHTGTGIYHPSGAYRATIADSSSRGIYAADGSLNLSLYPYTYTGQRATLFTTEAQTLISAMTTAPTEIRSMYITRLINSLKLSTVWDKLDVLYLMAAETAQAARLNWKAPGTFTLAAVGGGTTFTADRGFRGNGSSTAETSTFVPSTNGVNYVQNDASLWVWANLDQQDANPICGRVAALGYHLGTRNTSNNMGGRLNDNDTTTRANSDARGLCGVSRPVAGTKRYWRNGTQVGADVSVASTGVPTVSSWAAGGGSNSSWEDQQNALYALGASLSGLELSFYNSIADYMTSIGNV